MYLHPLRCLILICVAWFAFEHVRLIVASQNGRKPGQVHESGTGTRVRGHGISIIIRLETMRSEK